MVATEYENNKFKTRICTLLYIIQAYKFIAFCGGTGPVDGEKTTTRFPMIRENILNGLPIGILEFVTDADIENALQQTKAWPVFPTSRGFSHPAAASDGDVPVPPCGVAVRVRGGATLGVTGLGVTALVTQAGVPF